MSYLKTVSDLVATQMAELLLWCEGAEAELDELVERGEVSQDEAVILLECRRRQRADQLRAELRDEIRERVPGAWPADDLEERFR